MVDKKKKKLTDYTEKILFLITNFSKNKMKEITLTTKILSIKFQNNIISLGINNISPFQNYHSSDT